MFLKRLSFVAMAVSALLVSGDPALSQNHRILLENFHFYDAATESMLLADNMLIEDGIIKAFNYTDKCSDCERINLEAGFLIPGLIDAHQHLSDGGFSKKNLEERIALYRRNLYWGITTTFDPNVRRGVMRGVKAAVRERPNDYPSYFAAGQSITIPGGWGDKKVTSFQEVRNTVNLALASGSDAVKISFDDKSWLSSNPMQKFPLEWLEQTIAYAHRLKRKVYVSATQAGDVEAALNAGVDGILQGTVDKQLSEETINKLRDSQTPYISTLSMFEAIADVQASVKEQQAFDPGNINTDLLYQNMGSDLMATNWEDWWDKSRYLKAKLPVLRANTVMLVNNGALVGIGTDAGTPSVIFGASLPYEMELHERIKIPPLKVLKLATLNNAQILGIDEYTGSITEGKEADLVYLTDNPAGGIRALNSMVWVMQNGAKMFRREILENKGKPLPPKLAIPRAE